MSDYWKNRLKTYKDTGKLETPEIESTTAAGGSSPMDDWRGYNEAKRFTPESLNRQLGEDHEFQDYKRKKYQLDIQKRYRDPREDRSGSMPPTGGHPLGPLYERVADGSTATYGEVVEAEGRYAEGGVKIDVLSGADAGDRFLTSFMRDVKDRTKYYQNNYGEDSVRVAKDDNGDDVLIIRKPDGTDLLVDEKGMTGKDLADLAGYMPEVVGAFVGAGVAGQVATKFALRPILKYMIQTLGAAGAGQTLGGGQDLLSRASVGNDLQPAEIALERSKRFGADVATDMAFGSSLRIGKKLYNFGANPSRMLKSSYEGLSSGAISARDKIKKLTRGEVDIPLDPATITENEFVMRMQAFMSNMPGSRALKDLIDKQKQSLRDVYQYLSGGAENLTSQETGKKAIREITKQLDDLGNYKEKVRTTIVNSGVRKLNKIYEGTAPGRHGRNAYASDSGEALRQETLLQYQLFKGESDKLYSTAGNLAGRKGEIFDATGFKSVAKAIYGRALKDSKGKPINEVLSPDVLKFINIANKSKSKINYDEIKTLRGRIDDTIKEGVAMRGVDDTHLIELSRTLGESITDAGGNKEIQKALHVANLHYKKYSGKFKTKMFSSIYKKPGRGGIENEELVDLLLTGKSARYKEFKDLIGHNPDAFSLVKHSVVNDILTKFSDGNTVNAADMLKHLTDPKRVNREVMDDVFGKKQFAALKRELKLLEKVKDPRVKVSDLEELISSGTSSRARLEKLIASRKREELNYKNNILKKVMDGDLSEFNPQDFVDYSLVSGNVDDITKLMGMVDGTPAGVDLKRKVIQKYFYTAAKKVEPEDFNKPGILIDPNRMKQLLDGNGQIKDARAKLEAILSGDEMELFNGLMAVTAATGAASKSGKVAGGLAAGGLINSMITSGPLRTLNSTVRYAFAAHMLTNPVTLKWLQNSHQMAELPDMARVVMTSPAFISAVLSDGNYEKSSSRLFLGFGEAFNELITTEDDE